MHTGEYFRVEWQTYEDSNCKRSFRHKQNAEALYRGIIKNSDTLKATLSHIDNGNRRYLRTYDKPRLSRVEVRPLAKATYDPVANW